MRRRQDRWRGLLLITLLPLLAWWGPGREEAARGDSSRAVVVEVKAGDTLWEIARRYGEGGDVRALISDIKRWNGLEKSEIYPGQRLVVYIR